MPISIIKVENNRIAKFAEFQTVEEAQSHCDIHGGFVYNGAYNPELFIDVNNAVSVVPYPVIIPSSVTMRQARLALLGAGLLPNVTTAINALPSPQKEAATIEWEYSQEVHRNKPFVAVLAGALGLTDAQLDNLFLTASTL